MLTSRVSWLCKRLDEKQNGPIYALVGPLMFHEFYKNSESSFSPQTADQVCELYTATHQTFPWLDGSLFTKVPSSWKATHSGANHLIGMVFGACGLL